MSHAFDKTSSCVCPRCVRERTRRAAQSSAHKTYGHAAVAMRTMQRRNRRDVRVMDALYNR